MVWPVCSVGTIAVSTQFFLSSIPHSSAHHLYVYLSTTTRVHNIHQPGHLSMHTSTHQPIHLSIHPTHPPHHSSTYYYTESIDYYTSYPSIHLLTHPPFTYHPNCTPLHPSTYYYTESTLSIHPPTHPHAHTSTHLSTHLPIVLSLIYPPTTLSIHLSIRSSTYHSIHPLTYPASQSPINSAIH